MAVATTYIEIAGDTSKYERAMRDVRTSTEKMSSAVKRYWLEIAAATYGAMKAWDLLKLGARAQQEEQAFRNMAASYGASADQIISDLKRASGQTVDTMTLIQKAGTAMMMGIEPEKVSRLMEIARATARMTGQSVTKAFEDISLAVGRQSRMILDNLGIIVRVEQANEQYAAQIGKTASELTEAEKKQAFLNATLLAGEDLMRRLGDETRTTAEMFQNMEAFASNLKAELGKGLLVVIKWVVMAFTQAGATVNLILEKIVQGMADLYGWIGMLPGGELLGFQNAAEKLGAIAEQFRLAREAANQFTLELYDMDEAAKQLPPVMVYGRRETGGGGGTDKDLARAGEQAAAEMAKAQETLIQKTEMEKFMEEELTEYLYNMRQARLEHQTGFAQSAIELRQWEHDAALQIAKAQAEEEIEIEEYKARAKSQAMQNWAQTGMNIMAAVRAFTGKENKIVFAMAKALEVAKATMAAFSAANMALASPPGPPATIPLSQATLYMGLANAAAIAATAIGEMSAGTQGGAAIPTGAAVGATVPEVSPDVTPVSDVGGRPTVQIIIEGDSINDEEYLERWAEKISEMVESKDVRLYASNSKMAERLT